MSVLFRQRTTGFKAETTPGTLETLTNAECVTNVFDTEFKDETKLGAREPQGGLSQITGVRGAVSGSCTFKTEVDGNGTTGNPPWAALLLAAGCKNTTGVISPSAGALNTVSIGYWTGTRQRTLAGAQGTGVMKGKAGEIVMLDWSYKGLFAWSNTDTTIPASIVYRTNIPPRLVSATFTVGGVAFELPEFEFDLGCNVILIENANAAGGYSRAWITGRKPTFKFPTGAVPLATKDWTNMFQTNATAAIALQIGPGSDNNSVAFAAPAAQLAESPTDVNADDQLRDQLSFNLNRSGSTQDSEWSLTFS